VDFLATMQHMVAVEAMGPSAIRGQGKGVLTACQDYLARLPLEKNTWFKRETIPLLDRPSDRESAGHAPWPESPLGRRAQGDQPVSPGCA